MSLIAVQLCMLTILLSLCEGRRPVFLLDLGSTFCPRDSLSTPENLGSLHRAMSTFLDLTEFAGQVTLVSSAAGDDPWLLGCLASMPEPLRRRIRGYRIAHTRRLGQPTKALFYLRMLETIDAQMGDARPTVVVSMSDSLRDFYHLKFIASRFQNVSCRALRLLSKPTVEDMVNQLILASRLLPTLLNSVSKRVSFGGFNLKIDKENIHCVIC